MHIAAPVFYQVVVAWIAIILAVVTFVVELIAFVHCAMQRADAFSAVGTFSKGMWLLMIAGTALFIMLGFGAGGILSGILAMVPITIALIYLLDVRPALRDATGGHGPW
ncbi:MAG: DUF2516 family protein [Micromonosporaceae bacterium]|nr:DUF2516 family protein [Micromonosporaceae bacterium]